ncbi:MAG: YkgJ family cysteine cluster protein [Cellulosilyticaceae bacterium]
MECREKCGACCIAPSITTPIPGMENGKPAGVRCIQLDEENKCKIFKHPERPKVCGGLQPAKDMCGCTQEDALQYLDTLERLTAPDRVDTKK